MYISSVNIKGFRCFDMDGQEIKLDKMTCLVGPNASGKTATMAALSKVYGETQIERSIKPSDFHLSPGEKLKSKKERKLSIDIKLELPELSGSAAERRAIPEVFNQMLISEPGGNPYCIVQLQATWIDDGTAQGEIEQKLSWILTPSNDPGVIELSRRPMRPAERSRVKVIYVPAAREPASQIKTTSATAFGRLLKAIEWSGQGEDIAGNLEGLKASLEALKGLKTINSQVQKSWAELYGGKVASNVAFQSVDSDPVAVLGSITPTFYPDEQGQNLQVSELSDGLRSLFSLSLPISFYQVEEALKENAKAAGFNEDVCEQFPLLTLFAVEEPENHLSPHYLGKIVSALKSVSDKYGAQSILSSHSPSIMRRVEPDCVRYYLGGETRSTTKVVCLDLPEDKTDESFKYVREAVRGFPELYFSRLVILGEGPSEEIILRKAFEASGSPLDQSFISIVPLGGRHVNHFWKLLSGLGIQYITLLDFDREKEGAGWGRLRYVRDQLVNLYGENSPRLLFESENGSKISLGAIDDSTLGGEPTDKENMGAWIYYFRENFNIYFSEPLDIDFSMLKCFPEVYKGQAPSRGGPRLPAEEPELSLALIDRMRQVLAADATKAPGTLGASYEKDEVELFAWYKYLFVDGSKPVSHMRAMIELEDTNWIAKAPQTLKELIDCAKDIVNSAS
ncbi:hypothetical protein B6S59_07075 [Pseudomonas sp. A46]|nr:hypothetical protein B6S59_07075 [Pseudomonas sp. A46]